jgi:hypothetical protein
MGKTKGAPNNATRWPGILQSVTDKTKALALICLIINAIFLTSLPALEVRQKTYALFLCFALLALIAGGIVFIELRDKRTSHTLGSADDNLSAVDIGVPNGLLSLMQSSNWPMFFTDVNRIVLRCNTPMGQLLDSSEHDFEGKPVAVLVERLAQHVPKPRRSAFLQRQAGLQEKYSSRLHPNSDDFEYLDTTNHPASNVWRGKFKLWIHADRVKLGGKDIGYFVIYHAERTDRIPV